MDVRPVEPGDRARIREIVEQSFQTSYSLSPREIEAVVEAVFSEGALGDRIDDPDRLVLVADGDKEGEPMVVGVAVVELGETGALRWLHVEPGARGGGAGTALFERARDEVAAEGGRLSARVLDQASEGGDFCEQFGFERTGDVAVDVGGERFHEQVYESSAEVDEAHTEEDEPNEPEVDVPETVDVDGGALPLDRDEEIPGTESPFFHVYADETREDRYGFFCSNCGSTDVSGDDLDRLECGDCGNAHRAEDWDGAYL